MARSRFDHAETFPAHASALYLGDLVPMLRALVKAEFEAYAMRRHSMTPEVSAAVDDLAAGATELVELGKWVQAQIWGFTWYERPPPREDAA